MGLLISNLILVISLKKGTKRIYPYFNSLKRKRLDPPSSIRDYGGQASPP